MFLTLDKICKCCMFIMRVINIVLDSVPIFFFIFYSNCNMNLKRYTMTCIWTKCTYFSCWILRSKQYMHINVELTISVWSFDVVAI